MVLSLTWLGEFFAGTWEGALELGGDTREPCGEGMGFGGVRWRKTAVFAV